MKVILLQHATEINDQESVKVIGIFSNETKAKNAISELLNQPGFKDFSENCFFVDEYELDDINWREGFISWSDAST